MQEHKIVNLRGPAHKERIEERKGKCVCATSVRHTYGSRGENRARAHPKQREAERHVMNGYV